MLLAEDPLDLLLERLRGLPPADRRAILGHLSATERRRVEAALDHPPGAEAPRFAPDIAARIAAPTDGSMTAAAREALLRIAGASAPVEPARPSPSLFGRLGDAMRRR